MKHWFAGRTRSRAEKAVCRTLETAGVDCYLPLIPRERQWADRVKFVDLPLFPGYIFVRSDTDGLRSVLWVPGLAGIVQVNGRPSPIPAEDLESVRAVVEGVKKTGILPAPTSYLEVWPGQTVEVVEGPFAGVRGILNQSRGKTRVAVLLSAVRLAVLVELDLASLRTVASPDLISL